MNISESVSGCIKSCTLLLAALFVLGAPAHAADYIITVTKIADVAEGAPADVVSVSLSPTVQAGENIQIQWMTVDGSATVADSDYSTDSGVLVFTTGESEKKIAFSASAEGQVENDETVGIRVFNPSYVSGSGNLSGDTDVTRSITISNTDTAVVTLAGATTSAVEGNSLYYDVHLSNPVAWPVTVSYGVVGSGADIAESTDYTGGSSVVIPAGSTTASIEVALVNDSIVENTEGVTVTLSGVSPSTSVSLGGSVSATGSIQDNDNSIVTLSGATTSAVEGNSLYYDVQLSNPVAWDVTVSYGVVGSGADNAEPADYTSGTTVTIPAGSTTVPVEVALVNDSIVENTEGLTVTLSGVSPSTSVSLGGSVSATGSIQDNDNSIVTLSGATTSADEGNSLYYDVHLSNPVAWPVTVSYGVVGSGADSAEPADYTSGTTVTIPAGSTIVPVEIVLVNDSIVENTEGVTVTLSGVSPSTSVSLGGSVSATGSIQDNDSSIVTLSGATTSAVEGNSLYYDVQLSNPVAWDVTVSYGVVGSGADSAEPADYTSGTTVTIPAGSTTVPVEIVLVNDSIVENTEGLTVTLSGVSPSTSVSLGGSVSATGSIQDNDSAIVTLSGATTSADEGNSLYYDVQLSNPVAWPVTVSYGVVGSGADNAEPADYTSGTTVTIPAGSTTVPVEVVLVNDSIVENTEGLTVTLSGVSPSTSVSLGGSVSATGSIQDNDSAIVTLSGATTSADEGNSLYYDVQLSNPVAWDVTVSYGVVGSGADSAEPADYTSGTTVTIPAGSTTVPVEVVLVNDSIVENTEGLTVTLSGVSPSTSVSLGGSVSATGSIQDNDSSIVTLSGATTSAVEGNSLYYDVQLSNPVAWDVTVSYGVVGSGADSAEPADYTSGTNVIIPAGGTTVSIEIPLVDDNIVENSEELTISLSSVSPSTSVSLGSSVSATGTIQNNDTATITLSGGVTSGLEGTSLSYSVELTNPVAWDVTVNYTVAGSGTDVAEVTDYSISGPSVLIPAGVTSVLVPVGLVDDSIAENTEGLTVHLSTFSPSTLLSFGGIVSLAGSIQDNDIAELSITDVSVHEDAGPAVFTVTSSKVVSPTAVVNFEFATSDVTAKAGTDYTSTAGPLTITNGDTITISVPIIPSNSTVEPDETFHVQLTNLTGVPSGFAKDLGVGTILNDDFLITITNVSPFGTLTETTGIGVVPSSGDVNSLVFPLGSNPVFELAAVTCPNGLTHNGKHHHISDLLVDGVSEPAAIGQSTHSYTFSNISQDHTIESLFTSYVDFTVHTNGHIETVSGNVAAGSNDSIEIKANDTLAVTAVPDLGYHIAQVLVDGVSVGIPETYSFSNWVDADATYEISFAINQFIIEPVSKYDTVFSDAAETIVATSKTVNFGASAAFYVNLNDPTYAVYGVLIDNVSYPIPASGVTVNYTDFTLSNSGNDYLAVTFVGVDANHRLEVQDYDTSPISDVPLDAKLRPKPASIMFVLDDSGSMDWEVITSSTDGVYIIGSYSNYYIYSYPDINRARVYGDKSLEANNDHDEWRSQFFGVNKMFYNPTVTYVPWPTFTGTPSSQLPAVAGDGLAHANMYRPRFHPWYSQDCTDAINLANGITTANLGNCDTTTHNNNTFPMDDLFLEYEDNTNALIVDNSDAVNFVSVGNWGTSTNSDMYGSNYLYTTAGATIDTATWKFSPTTTEEYSVYTRYVDTASRRVIPYTISCGNCGTGGTTVTVNQASHGGEWILLGDFDLIAGENVTVKLVDNFNQTSSSCADAVKIVPKTNTIRILNAHYFTWNDVNNDGEIGYTDANSNGQMDQTETITEDVYLVNLSNPIGYYKVINNALPVSGSNLQKIAAASLPATVKTFASPTDSSAWEKERQNWADWFSYYRKRTLAATGAVARVIDQMEDVEVGIRTINYNSGVYGIGQAALPVKVAGVGDDTNTLLQKLYSFQVAGYGTPLRNGLKKVGEYFQDTSDLTQSPIVVDTKTGDLGANSPFYTREDGDECKQVFAIVMTDGYYNGSNPYVGNVDGNNGIPYADSFYNSLADVAMYYFENDLSSLDNLVPDGIHNHQHMVTYTVAFGVYGTLNPADYDFNTAHYPTWPNPSDGNNQKIDDMWHAAVNGRGKFMSASRPDELVDSLLDIMNDIGTRVGSGSSVSVNGDEMYESVSGQTRMFQTTYNSGDWHGDLKAYQVDTTTGDVLTSAPVWSAEDLLATTLTSTGAGHVNRIVATYTGTAGTAFRWANLTALQKQQLFPYFIESTTTTLTGENVVNYIRGNKADELTTSSGEFRARDAAHPIGDIIHSLARFEDDVLYVGANDGMLHAFLATDSGMGKELFAYVPNLVLSNLRELADPTYDHLFYVDNTPDVQKMGTKTYLVGGLGKGGKGYYCLDVTGVLTSAATSPRSSTVTTESDLASRVKWEYPALPAVLLSGNTFTFLSGVGSGGNDVIRDSNNGFSSTLFTVGQTVSIIGANYANGVISGTNDGQYKIKVIDPGGAYIEIESGSLITGYGDGKNISITQATSDPSMGYSYSKAFFIETNDTTIGSGDLRGWVVVFGNGYASENGTASLYIVNPATGALIKRIETNVGPFNGLSSPNAIDVDNDLRVDYVYAGDLLGNMWKFDLTSTNHSDWQVAYCEGGNSTAHCKETVAGMIPKPLFAGLSNQPITGAPDIMRHQTKEGYMVIFGTGKYVGEPDLTSIYTQSLYGIWDWAPDTLDTGYNGARVDVSTSATLSNWPETNTSGYATHTLLKQVALSEGLLDTDGDGVVDSSSYYRVISNYTGDWTLHKTSTLALGHRFRNMDINGDGSVNDSDLVPAYNVGWVFDLPSKIDILKDGQDNDKDGTTDEAGERIPGERVVNDAIIRDGKAILLSFGVTGTRCNAGAYSFLNERDANTGGMTSSAIYDVNGDGEIDADDVVYVQATTDVNGDGHIDSSDVVAVYPSDIGYDGRLYNPAILRENDGSDKNPEEKKYFSTSQGSIIVVSEKAERRGFSYWQQME